MYIHVHVKVLPQMFSCAFVPAFCWLIQEPFDAQSFVSRLLGFGDVKGLMRQLQESQEDAGDPKEMMCVRFHSSVTFSCVMRFV